MYLSITWEVDIAVNRQHKWKNSPPVCCSRFEVLSGLPFDVPLPLMESFRRWGKRHTAEFVRPERSLQRPKICPATTCWAEQIPLRSLLWCSSSIRKFFFHSEFRKTSVYCVLLGSSLDICATRALYNFGHRASRV